MCLNKKDSKGKEVDPQLFGQNGSDYRYIEMNVIPCKPIQLTSRNKHRQNTECIANLRSPKAMIARLEETKKYLNSPQLLTMNNSGRFDL